jgi:hypothetical protein
MNVRTQPGVTFETDHNLLYGKIRIRLKNLEKKKVTKRFNVEALKRSTVATRYSIEVSNRFEALLAEEDSDDLDPEELWTKAAQIIKEAADRTIGRVKRRVKKEWLSASTLLLIEKKRRVKDLRHHSDDLMEEYKMLKRDVQREVRKDRERWLESECGEAEEMHRRGNMSGVYKKIAKLTSGQRTHQGCIKDRNGNVLTEKSQVRARVKEYTEQLYSKPDNDRDMDEIEVGNDIEPEVTLEEVQEALMAMKRGKSPGVDEIPIELLMGAGESAVRILHRICNRIWNRREWPSDWTKAIFVMVPKTGDLKDCKNYRTISLLSHASKVLLRIINNRMRQYSERELPEEQAGFRPGRGTRDMLVILQLLIEKTNAMSNTDLYMVFIDYTKAFDRVSHPRLLDVMLSMGIPKHLVALIQELYIHQTASVRWEQELSDWFGIGKGTRQGCNISPVEFNLYAEDIMRRALEDSQHGVTVGGRRIDNIRYADDTTLLATTQDGVREMMERLVAESEVSNMAINGKKTKVMVGSRRNAQVQVMLEGEQIEQVDHFKFLGSQKSSNGDCTPEIKRRIAMAREKAVRLDSIWHSRSISLQLKLRLMKALVWSVFLYGVESWTIKVSDRNRIMSFEMWCWRRILKVSWREHRTDDSILEELGLDRQLMARVAQLKFQYFGHVVRGSAGELAMVVLEGSVEGVRHRGAPRL